MANQPSNQRHNDNELRNAFERVNLDDIPRANQAAQVQPPEERPETYNWQISKRSLKERFEFLFNNEALADVHFIVGSESARIPAHKLGNILPSSSVFLFVFSSLGWLRRLRCSIQWWNSIAGR